MNDAPRNVGWSAMALLERFSDLDCAEELLGDAEENFHRRLDRNGPFLAHLLLWRDVLSLLRIRLFRRRRSRHQTDRLAMLKNHVRVAWRRFAKNRSHSLINVVGLGVGIASCILVGLYVRHEMSYDTFHEKGDRIYRITTLEKNGLGPSHAATTPMPMIPSITFDFDFATLERGTRIHPYPTLVRYDSPSGKPLMWQEDAFAFVDSTFLDVFSFPFLSGDRTTALDSPHSIVVTESSAKRYFGGAASAVGKTLSIRSDEANFDFTVTAVVEDPPTTSSIRFSMVSNISTLLRDMESHRDNWYWPPVYSFVLLAPASSPDMLESEINQRVSPYLESMGLNQHFELQPLESIHLQSDLEGEMASSGSMQAVLMFSLIAGLILFIAIINFMNLATARSIGRAREIGVRKAMGAGRIQVAGQFLMESTVTTLVAVVLALGLTRLALPGFTLLTGVALRFGSLITWDFFFLLVALVLGVGILAGSYPAVVLSAFRPSGALKGQVGLGNSVRIRQALVVVQFAITIVLLIGTLVIDRQLDYMLGDRLGFDRERVVVVPLRDQNNQENHEALRNEWLRDPGVVSVSSSSGYPSHPEGLYNFRVVPGDSPEDSLDILVLTVDEDYAETFGLELVSGRDFSRGRSTDASSAFMINEAAAQKLGWKQPVGKELALEFYVRGPVEKRGEIIGVFRNFQVKSLRQAVEPMVLHILPGSFYNDFVSARLAPGTIPRTMQHLASVWNEFNPDRPFEYRFLDDAFDELYRNELRMGMTMKACAGLAILIACLGLFALVTYTTEQRTREIGIRKVLGASIGGIVLLLSRDFMKLVALAFLISVPIAWLAASSWLNGFADQISLGISLFLLAGTASLVIGAVTVSIQATRAARANPADSLRTD